jgi:acetoin utilization protein AcuA
MDSFTEYPWHKPIISQKKTLVEVATQPDANVTVAFTTNERIIGFGVLQYPDPDERWVRVGDRITMEASVIEVDRLWRTMGIAKELLALLMHHPLREDRIIYMVGYSWTWDLKGSTMSAMDYRTMLIKLGSPYGFKPFQTNEPNVLLRPENLFMARIGAHISEEVRKRFKHVRFNLDRYH